jgi:hypothetical protein
MAVNLNGSSKLKPCELQAKGLAAAASTNFENR